MKYDDAESVMKALEEEAPLADELEEIQVHSIRAADAPNRATAPRDYYVTANLPAKIEGAETEQAVKIAGANHAALNVIGTGAGVTLHFS